MPDAFDDNATWDPGLSLDLIEEEIEAGLPMHARRLAEAFVVEEYYAGRNSQYVKRRESEEWLDYQQRPKRVSLLTRKVVRALSANLYAPGPTRRLEGDASADAWLQDVYRTNHVDALMQQGDRKASLSGLAAVQATGTGRAEKPILLSLWGSHEIVWYCWPDDPTEAWAVVTIARLSKIDGSRQMQRLRFEAWSRDEHRTYLTEWRNAPPDYSWAQLGYRDLFGQPATFVAELSGDPAGSGKNSYGVLPFAFIHDELPVSRLDEGGIGPMLVHCNADLDREYSDLAHHVQKYMDPYGWAKNVPAGFRVEKRKGGFQILTPSAAVREGDQKADPEVGYLQSELAVEAVLAHARNYADQTLEELDVPLSAVRGDASTDLSGIAIVAKQLPLLQRVKARQVPFGQAEDDLAAMVLACGGNFYGEPRLVAAAQAPKLSLLWPEPAFPLPTPERDASDTYELENHITSLPMVVAQRRGTTRDGAFEHLKQVAKDNAEVLKLLPPPEPEPVEPAAIGADGEPAPSKDSNEP